MTSIIYCDCGGKYQTRNHSKHLRTKMHSDYKNSNDHTTNIFKILNDTRKKEAEARKKKAEAIKSTEEFDLTNVTDEVTKDFFVNKMHFHDDATTLLMQRHMIEQLKRTNRTATWLNGFWTYTSKN